MMNWLRNRMALVAASLLVAVALTACGGAAEKKVEPAPAAPVAQTAPAPAPAPAPVDKDAIIKEAVVAYFGALPANSNMLEPADVLKKVGDASVQFIDIRKAEDFAKGHIPGAINLPMGTVGKEIAKIAKDKQVIVNCYSGQTSGQTIALLKLTGINAVSLKGGFPAYEKLEGAKIEK